MDRINYKTKNYINLVASSPSVQERFYFYYFTKRMVDLVLASIFLLIILPLLAILALLIKLDSPGPVIFSQKRVGSKLVWKNGFVFWEQIDFTCYKFRTMILNADSDLHKKFITAFINNDHAGMNQAQGKESVDYKLENDPRITRVGKYLRKFSLDEFPQFWNVVKGEMSLVGPRPEVPYTVQQFEPWHYERLNALPGITGLWQVYGRSRVTFDEMVKMDIEYTRSHSLWLDFKLMLLTIPAVLSTKGAK